MRIGIFGGSFNPVHYGHVAVARAAVEDLGLDRLLVVPASTSPFKAIGRKPEFFSRLEAVSAAFRDIPKAEVDLREIRRGGVSYAIDTVSAIAEENPDAQLFFIVGEDSLAGLPMWKDYDRLAKLCTFKAYARTPESSTRIRELFDRGGVVENPDAKIVRTVRDGLARKGWFCPCRLAKAREYFCPCEEFLAQLADDGYRGFCHCRLYLKK